MKKIYTIIILTVFSSILSSLELEKMFHQDRFYYQMNSFMGTDYFPDREYKSTNYFDRHAFYAGWNYNYNQNVKVWFDLTFNDKFYEKEILLNKTGITYQKNYFSFSYKIDRLKYGEKSQIYNLQVKDRFYDFGVIENYRYNGVELEFSKDNFLAQTTVAANDFNSVIANSKIGYHQKLFNLQLYYLFVGRNDEYNERNHSFGVESSFSFFDAHLYQSFVYQHLPNYSKGDKTKSLLEISYSPFNYFSLGTNIFSEKFENVNSVNWQSQSFLNINVRNLQNYFFYRVNNIEEFSTDYLNKEYSYLTLYKFSNLFSMGINYSFFTPDFDIDYHQIGFQVNFNYEKDI